MCGPEDKEGANVVPFDVLGDSIPRKLQRAQAVCVIFDPIERTVQLEETNWCFHG